MRMLFSISCQWISVSVTHRGQILYSIYIPMQISLSDWWSCQGGKKMNLFVWFTWCFCGCCCCCSCSCWISPPLKPTFNREQMMLSDIPRFTTLLTFPRVYMVSYSCPMCLLLLLLAQGVLGGSLLFTCYAKTHFPSTWIFSFHGNAFNRSPTFHRPAATSINKKFDLDRKGVGSSMKVERRTDWLIREQNNAWGQVWTSRPCPHKRTHQKKKMT